MMRLPLLLASIAAAGSAQECTIEAKLLAVASRHIDLHIRNVDANGTRKDVWGEMIFHCALYMNNGTEILPELRVTWEDIGLVNIWVRGLVDLRGKLLLEVSHAPDGCTEATGTFDLELNGDFDDFVAPYDGDDADEVVGTSKGGLVLFDRREKDGGQKIPLRFDLPVSRREVYAQAVHAVERLRLWKEGFPGCLLYDRACQATQIVELLDASLKLAEREPPPKCRLSLDRPRDGEVLVLGDVACELGVEVYENETWHWKAFLAGPVHLDAYPSQKDGGSALWSTAAGQHWNALEEDHRGQVSISLKPAFRREGGGGAMDGGLRSLFRVEAAAYFGVKGYCEEPRWYHAAKTVTYRPFQEPEVPARIWDRASLAQRTLQYTKTAVATILYGSSTDTGYVHGALTLKQSLLENGVSVPFYALLGDGMDEVSRNALQSFGFICRDVHPLQNVKHSSALPALGLGQWAKLQLWKIDAERVIYLDSDVLVLRDVSELFSALDGGEPLAAPNDYLSGGVLVLKPNPHEPFDATLAEDSGLYVYGEQDFLNVHFAGRHTRLSLEYKCSAEKVASGEWPKGADACSILEFDSCTIGTGNVAWKPWHGTGMFNSSDFRVCFRKPDATIIELTERWAAVHPRALEALTVPLAPPRPYGPLQDLTHFRVVRGDL